MTPPPLACDSSSGDVWSPRARARVCVCARRDYFRTGLYVCRNYQIISCSDTLVFCFRYIRELHWRSEYYDRLHNCYIILERQCGWCVYQGQITSQPTKELPLMHTTVTPTSCEKRTLSSSHKAILTIL